MDVQRGMEVEIPLHSKEIASRAQNEYQQGLSHPSDQRQSVKDVGVVLVEVGDQANRLDRDIRLRYPMPDQARCSETGIRHADRALGGVLLSTIRFNCKCSSKTPVPKRTSSLKRWRTLSYFSCPMSCDMISRIL